MSNIIEKHEVSRLAEEYQNILNKTHEGLELLLDAQARMEMIFGQCSSIIPNNELRLYSSGIGGKDRFKNESHQEIRKNAWRHVLKAGEIENFMTTQDKGIINTKINNNEIPEFTIENIYGTLEGFALSVNDNIQKIANDVYRYFHPYNSRYKTNKKYRLGEKAIMVDAVECVRGFWRLRYDSEVFDIHRLCCLLDGKGVPKRGDTLDSHIREKMWKKETECENEYVFCRWYKAGTIHFKFKRPDLVKKINELAGNDTDLPGEGE